VDIEDQAGRQLGGKKALGFWKQDNRILNFWVWLPWQESEAISWQESEAIS